jgi:hypothetical protein
VSHPGQKLVNDFIDSNFSSLRYSSIDDIQRGLLNASEINIGEFAEMENGITDRKCNCTHCNFFIAFLVNFRM